MLRNLISFFVFAGIATLAACQPPVNKSAPEVKPTATKATPGLADFKSHSLTLYGYNYTDFSIGSFEANGQGGGNLWLSSPSAAGGSSVCCFNLFTPLPADNKIKIRWLGNKRYCELEVPFSGPIPAKPEYLEVHFYPDGHVEVAVTENYSPPRLKLKSYNDGQRYAELKNNKDNDDRFAKCEPVKPLPVFPPVEKTQLPPLTPAKK